MWWPRFWQTILLRCLRTVYLLQKKNSQGHANGRLHEIISEADTPAPRFFDLAIFYRVMDQLAILPTYLSYFLPGSKYLNPLWLSVSKPQGILYIGTNSKFGDSNK